MMKPGTVAHLRKGRRPKGAFPCASRPWPFRNVLTAGANPLSPPLPALYPKGPPPRLFPPKSPPGTPPAPPPRFLPPTQGPRTPPGPTAVQPPPPSPSLGLPKPTPPFPCSPPIIFDKPTVLKNILFPALIPKKKPSQNQAKRNPRPLK